MNCKPGDLALVINQSSAHPNRDKIVQITKRSDLFPDSWVTNPVLRCYLGMEIHWKDCSLRPIRDTPSEDETLQWAPVPGERVTA